MGRWFWTGALSTLTWGCGENDVTTVVQRPRLQPAADGIDESPPSLGESESPPEASETDPPAGLEPAPDAMTPVDPEWPYGPGVPFGPPETIFEREHVIEVRIEMAPADWEALSFEGVGIGEVLFPDDGFIDTPEYTHFAAEVTVDGVRHSNVDVRKKGYIGSLSVIRPSLKLNFSARYEGTVAAGLKRMTLNNDLQDSTHARQCMAYDMFHALGMPAPRCNFAHVVVNGVDLGFYTHVEPIKKPMLERYFEDAGGNLYEGEQSDFSPETAVYLEVKNNEGEAEGSVLATDREDVRAVIDALALPDDEVVEALGRVVELDSFFDFWALETLLGHWDGYAGKSNNFYAYHDPTSDRFYFIPWGMDQAFVGEDPNVSAPYLITVYARSAIAGRLYDLPEQRERYRRRLGELNDQLWRPEDLVEQAEAIRNLAWDASREAVAQHKSYLRSHGERLRAALLEPAPEWVDEPPPAPPLDDCVGTSEPLSGTFSTQWGPLDPGEIFANGSRDFDVAMQMEGQPLQASFVGRAGELDLGGGPLSGLRLLGQRQDGWIVVVDMGLPIEVFEPGHHPLHSFESYGLVGLVNPQTGAFSFLGLVGDGFVELTRASMEDGDAVAGRFEAQAHYFLCASTAIAFSQPPAPPPE